ncbi:hypothetical protein MMC19_005001 [Ptychographa xylographoides]|nr:hypothetical protein [Ptychographa xylographoides]
MQRRLTDETGDDKKKKRAPIDYHSLISEHTKRAQDVTLHPGTHYRSLSTILGAYPKASVQPPSTGAWHRSHTLATIHDLAYEPGDVRRVSHFDSATGLQSFAKYPLPQNESGQLLFLRGYPSPEWLNLIGGRYRVDPELFRRYISFGNSRDLYDLPAPPSSSENIVRLSSTSIGRQSTASLGRKEGSKALQKYLQSIGGDPDLTGESIVRRFSVHDNEHFSVEQDILICTIRRGGGWICMLKSTHHPAIVWSTYEYSTALILLDTGRDLDQGPIGPWSVVPPQRRGFEERFVPVIQFERKICYKEHERGHLMAPLHAGESNSKLSFSQSASLLSTQVYGRYLTPALMRVDAFYALHELFTFTACSENQFLNLLKIKLDAESQKWGNEEYMQQSLQNLTYHKAILHEHIEHLHEVIACIKRRGGSNWPRVKSRGNLGRMSSDNSSKDLSGQTVHQGAPQSPQLPQHLLQEELATRAVDRLLQDHESLLRKAQNLVRLYRDGTDEIRNSAALSESKKAIEQARGVARLTFLAFLFIPLSFTTSFFGMNFKELGSQLSIWIWFAVSIPVFAIALVLYFWTKFYSVFQRLWPWIDEGDYKA